MIEEQPVNTILTTLHATDADSTISEYQLIDADDGDNGSEFFDINNVTGECVNMLGYHKMLHHMMQFYYIFMEN